MSTVWIWISHGDKAIDYIRSQEPFQNNFGMGSGMSGSSFQLKSTLKYPIYRPLIISSENRSKLSECSSLIYQLLEEYFTSGKWSVHLSNESLFRLNEILHGNGYSPLSDQLFREALLYFCWDYLKFPQGTTISQPLNYVLSTRQIDGVYDKDGLCMSFLPPEF